MTEVFIGLGSNLGDRAVNIEKARDLINEDIGRVRARSSLVESEPWGYQSINWFLNQVVVIDFDETRYSTGNQEDTLGKPDNFGCCQAMELLKRLREMEAACGRVRAGGYIDRLIDLDILFFGNLLIESKELTVPHPHLHERRFILVSLMELCPERIHPRLGLTVRQMMERCTDQGLVRIFKDHVNR